jgi:hypothetical protein
LTTYNCKYDCLNKSCKIYIKKYRNHHKVDKLPKISLVALSCSANFVVCNSVLSLLTTWPVPRFNGIVLSPSGAWHSIFQAPFQKKKKTMVRWSVLIARYADNIRNFTLKTNGMMVKEK